MTVDLPAASVPRPVRKAVVAALANLIVPPVGHFVAGAYLRGIVLWGLFSGLGLATLFGIVLAPGIPIIVLAWILVVAKAVVLSGDAAMIAWTRPRGASRQPIRWYGYLGVIALSLLLNMGMSELAKTQLVQAVRMPSVSMSPTLLVGDFIFVDKRRGGGSTPQRGEIVIYTSSASASDMFAKRVVGLPGETIELRDKQLWVDGRLIPEPYALHSDPATLPVTESPRDNLAAVRLGPAEVFLMGDNRENSADSRFTGPVPVAAVRGRAILIYLSIDASYGIRWGRIGRRLP